MSSFAPSGKLVVEGRDDNHTIKQLLARHEIDIHSEDSPFKIHQAGSDSQVIDGIAVFAKESGKHPIGFVLDTDPFKSGRRLTRIDRWRAIREQLVLAGIAFSNDEANINQQLPEDGFIGMSTIYEREIGIWLMPDNRTDFGTIEDLLLTLVPADDELFLLARLSTENALGISNRHAESRSLIQEKDRTKGELHAWLAWQVEPGLPYGLAIRRKYFGCDSLVAIRFVEWFRRLFQFPDTRSQTA